jgi:hypothetical protein
LEISSSSLSLRLALVEIDVLKPHEEVIEASVRALSKEMQTEGLVRDPIIVDQEENVILDGMHRFSALKALNCRFAPCCFLNYDSPQIKVGSWFRLFMVEDPPALAEQLLFEAHLDFSTRKISAEIVSYNPHAIILTGNRVEYSLPENLNLFEHARTAVRLEKIVISGGHNVDYHSEIVAMQRLNSGSANLVICLPIFTKQQIREFGLQNRLLPHKVTRHVIPSRPLRIDIPLELLRRPNVPLDDANREVGELLAARHVERRAPGSIVDGRRYQEELLVFS